MTKPGLNFEKAVAQFLRTLDPGARVEHDVKLPDQRTGTLRQVDVLITARACGHPLRIACSCKDWATRLDIGDIDTFSAEMRAVGACTGILYARSGFTLPAVQAAKKEGISCCRLYQDDPADIPEAIFLPMYCSVPR